MLSCDEEETRSNKATRGENEFHTTHESRNATRENNNEFKWFLRCFGWRTELAWIIWMMHGVVCHETKREENMKSTQHTRVEIEMQRVKTTTITNSRQRWIWFLRWRMKRVIEESKVSFSFDLLKPFYQLSLPPCMSVRRWVNTMICYEEGNIFILLKCVYLFVYDELQANPWRKCKAKICVRVCGLCSTSFCKKFCLCYCCDLLFTDYQGIYLHNFEFVVCFVSHL